MCSMQLLKAAKLMDEDAGLRREISSVIEAEVKRPRQGAEPHPGFPAHWP